MHRPLSVLPISREAQTLGDKFGRMCNGLILAVNFVSFPFYLIHFAKACKYISTEDAFHDHFD